MIENIKIVKHPVYISSTRWSYMKYLITGWHPLKQVTSCAKWVQTGKSIKYPWDWFAGIAKKSFARVSRHKESRRRSFSIGKNSNAASTNINKIYNHYQEKGKEARLQSREWEKGERAAKSTRGLGVVSCPDWMLARGRRSPFTGNSAASRARQSHFNSSISIVLRSLSCFYFPLPPYWTWLILPLFLSVQRPATGTPLPLSVLPGLQGLVKPVGPVFCRDQVLRPLYTETAASNLPKRPKQMSPFHSTYIRSWHKIIPYRFYPHIIVENTNFL